VEEEIATFGPRKQPQQLARHTQIERTKVLDTDLTETASEHLNLQTAEPSQPLIKLTTPRTPSKLQEIVGMAAIIARDSDFKWDTLPLAPFDISTCRTRNDVAP